MGGRRSGIPVRHRRLSPQPTCRPNRHRNKPYLEAAKYEFAALAYAKAQGGPKAADVTSAAFGCRKSGLRHFFEVFIAPLRLRRGQGAMQRNPCYARLFADLTRTPQGPSLVPSGQFTLCRQIRSKPPEGKAERRQWREERGGSPVGKGAPGRPHGPTQRDLCELHCAPPNPRGFFDRLRGAAIGCAPEKMRLSVILPYWPIRRFPG